jgi:hypothetical protein
MYGVFAFEIIVLICHTSKEFKPKQTGFGNICRIVQKLLIPSDVDFKNKKKRANKK